MQEHYECQEGRYYRGDHFYDFKDFFSDIDRESRVINFGCGRGSSLKEFPRGLGIDFNTKLQKVWEEVGVADRCRVCEATDIPANAHNFDWSISSDFLEHVQPDQVDGVIREMDRVAPSGKHVIHMNAESGYRGPNGENLHVSANNTTFWDETFERLIRTEELYTKRIGNYFFVCWKNV